MELEMNGLEVGHVDPTLKWQLPTQEAGTLLKFVLSNMIKTN